jgi:pantothenate synthetase
MGYRHEYIYSKNIILGKIIEAIELSDINVSIAVAKEEIILYPRGEKNLDEELVELPLSFLDEKSAEHFIQGLQFYQSKKFIKSAESLRRSLEEFLRSKLNNKKGLKVNIIELQKLLKIKNLDSQIRNTILQVFTFMDQYFNENSKHNDGNINEQENEFLVYQIGLLMRYINYNI